MEGEKYSDDYVAKLLAEDAKRLSKQYSEMGSGAFLPSKAPVNKPKPNTRFLQNLVKETTSHNAALLAKEAADSKARLDSLKNADSRRGGDIRKRQLGQIASLLSGGTSRRSSQNVERSSKRRRHDQSSDDEKAQSKSRSTGTDEGEGRSTIRSKDESDRARDKGRHRRSGRDHGRLSRSRSRSPVDERIKASRHRIRSRERRRSRSSSRTRSEGIRIKGRSQRSHRDRERSPEERHARSHRKNPKVEDDSDPLDEIIGPRPPPVPKVVSRGRGTRSSASGIDARFSTNYDPMVDVALDPDEEDDWDQALEALRDRQKWNQAQGNRMLAAGFTEEEVKKWENSGKGKREEDVTWAKKGEDREWDHGKILDTNFASADRARSTKGNFDIIRGRGDNTGDSRGKVRGRGNVFDLDDMEIIVRKRTPSVDMSWGRLKD